MTEQEQKAFEAWAEPILGDNPAWRESGEGELARQAWIAALTAANAVSEQCMGFDVVVDPTMKPNEMKAVQPLKVTDLGRYALEPQAQGELVYQIKAYDSQTAWHDAGLSAYEVTPAKERRILCTNPQAAEPASKE